MERSREIAHLLRQAEQDIHLLAVILFGSSARGDAAPASDVDVCLVLRPGSYDSLTLSRRKLDYAKYCDLDIQIFQQLPLYIRRRVLKEGRVLFARDEDALYELAYRTARAFGSFKRIYDGYLAEVAGAGS